MKCAVFMGVQAWLRSDLMPIRQERSTLVVFYGLKGEPLSPVAEAAAHTLINAAQALLADGRLDSIFMDQDSLCN